MGTTVQIFVATPESLDSFSRKIAKLLNVNFSSDENNLGLAVNRWSGLGFDLDVHRHALRDLEGVLEFTQFPIQITLFMYAATVAFEHTASVKTAMGVYLACLLHEKCGFQTAVTYELEQIIARFPRLASRGTLRGS